jgi:alpha/beta superfamily hydrolase
VPGHPELAHDEDVELGVEGGGHLGGHGHTAAGQAQHEGTGTAVVREHPGQLATGVHPIEEAAPRHPTIVVQAGGIAPGGYGRRVPSGGRDLVADLGVLARQSVRLEPGLEHHELFTMRGLLTVLWHGPPDAEAVLVACGGAMGGLLGPADGLYQDLGVELAAAGIGTLRVGYRMPGEMALCTMDVAAAVQLAERNGAVRAVTMGHSFGGAVAVRVGAALPEIVTGVVGLATQSAGCEVAHGLAGRPLLLVHGDADELLPPDCSLIVRELAGDGEVVIVPGGGHLLGEAGDLLRERLPEWVRGRLEG